MWRKNGKWIGLALVISLVFMATGCSDHALSEITVKDNNNDSYNKVMLKKIDKYKDVSAIEWLNNDQVFTEQKDGLDVYDLKTKKAETIHHKKNNNKYWWYLLSPDKKYAFIETSNSDDGTNNFFYMMDLDTKKQVPVSFAFQKDTGIESANWSDNQNLTVTSYHGDIYEAHVSGKTKRINHTIQDMEDYEERYYTVRVKDHFYYLDHVNLTVWNSQTNQTKVLMKDVDGFTLSPDKTKLAVEKIIPVHPGETFQGKDNTETKENLVVMNLDRKVQSTVAEGLEIGGIGWSPDSKKLAYNIMKSHSNELYVSNVYQSQPKLLSVNIVGFFADYDPIKWSPAGNKLLINGYLGTNQDPNYSPAVLHIITLE